MFYAREHLHIMSRDVAKSSGNRLNSQFHKETDWGSLEGTGV